MDSIWQMVTRRPPLLSSSVRSTIMWGELPYRERDEGRRNHVPFAQTIASNRRLNFPLCLQYFLEHYV